MAESAPRQRLLETAADLFYRDGFRAIGVDTLCAASGVGKMTLYRHFPGKDDLIVAYLEESDRGFWRWFEGVTAAADRPADKILAFFRALEGLVAQPACHGCPFLNAAVDFPDPAHPGHQAARAHKNAVRSRFRELAEAAGYAEPAKLADQLLLLMDGAFMAVRLFGADNPAVHVAAAEQSLLAMAARRDGIAFTA
jgi:AcrR family transcriptional regulator